MGLKVLIIVTGHIKEVVSKLMAFSKNKKFMVVLTNQCFSKPPCICEAVK